MFANSTSFKLELVLVIYLALHVNNALGLDTLSSSLSSSSSSSHLTPCLEKKHDDSDMLVSNTKCTYRISRISETEYLIIKNILDNLIKRHRTITVNYFSYYLDTTYLKRCDQYFDYVAVSQLIRKDFRHPSHLFDTIDQTKVKINETIRAQYEADWYYKYKMINYALQPSKNLELCNQLGLKLNFLLHDYALQQGKIFTCSSMSNKEQLVSTLVDYYIAQTFIKNCDGNLELLANSIYNLIKYDCERAPTFKLAYFDSKYLNMFRTCDAKLTANDLMNSGRFSNCSHIDSLNGLVNKKYCSWFEIVCKYPLICLKSMGWTEK